MTIGSVTDHRVGRQVLDNGVVLLVDPDPALGFVVVNCWVPTGSLDDPTDCSGLAHVVEHAMQGIAEDGGVAASSNATTSFDRTNYVDIGAPADLPHLLKRVHRRLTRPPAEFDAARHRAIVRAEIHQKEVPAHFGDGLRVALGARFGAESGFGRPPIGDLHDLDGVTDARIGAFLRGTYARRPPVVAIVGDVDTRSAMGAAAAQLGGLAFEPRPTDAPARPARGSAGSVRRPTPARQDMVRVLLELPDLAAPDGPAALVLAHLVAGAPWARLNETFVHTGQALGAALDIVPTGAGPTLMLVRMPLRPGVAGDAIAGAVLHELGGLMGPVCEQRLDAARAIAYKNHLGSLSSARSRAEQLCRFETYAERADHAFAVTQRIREVRPEQVRTAAQAHLLDPTLVVHTEIDTEY